jgi:hypothetical protein
VLAFDVARCITFLVILIALPLLDRSRGSSVSTVPAYGLDDRGLIPDRGRGRGFFLQWLRPDRLWGPPSLLYNGYRGSFPRGKALPRRDADHSPHLVPRLRMSRSYTSSHPCASTACSETTLPFTLVGRMRRVVTCDCTSWKMEYDVHRRI